MPDQVLSALLAAERVVITTHVRPDGDALGSQIGLALFLRRLGKQVAMLNSDPPPRNLDWLMDLAEVETYDGSLIQRQVIEAADAIVLVDTGVLERVGNLAPAVSASPARKLLIDHHPMPEDWYDARLLRTEASSTGELVFDVISAHDAGMIDTAIATALYTAIMTDTGSFRYGSTTPRVHRIVAELLERGDIRPESIHVAIYDMRQLSGLRLLGLVLDTITTLYDGRVAYAHITPDMLRLAGANSEEAEGFVSYPLSLEGVQAVVMFLEISTGVKASFRSKGDVPVNDWARHFGGGGHRNAAGAFIRQPLKRVIKDVMGAAPQFIDIGPREVPLDPDPSRLAPEDAALLSAFGGK
jgi:bifunctional oligoribonuclease and PAP phosphatase NrnA